MNTQHNLFLFGLAGLLGFSVLIISTPTAAQENPSKVEAPIEIIDRDGEAVDSAELGDGKEIESAQAAGPLARRGKAAWRMPGRIGAGAMIRNGNGKITIIDGDGEKREIDVQGARSVSVSQSSRTVVVDGETKTEVVGKAVVVDADGERHEYKLAPQGAQEPGADGPSPAFPRFRGTFRAERAANQFMIGVNCKRVSELLASQLGLEPNTGLVVQSVSNDSPAAKAGIQKHDILMFVEDRELSKISDLNEVVDKAGKEKAGVSLTIIRGGKEIGIDVGVVERPEQANNPIAGFPGMPGMPGLDFELRQALPGMILDLPTAHEFDMPKIMIPEMRGINEQLHKQIQEQMKEMRQQMDQMQKQLELK